MNFTTLCQNEIQQKLSLEELSLVNLKIGCRIHPSKVARIWTARVLKGDQRSQQERKDPEKFKYCKESIKQVNVGDDEEKEFHANAVSQKKQAINLFSPTCLNVVQQLLKSKKFLLLLIASLKLVDDEIYPKDHRL